MLLLIPEVCSWNCEAHTWLKLMPVILVNGFPVINTADVHYVFVNLKQARIFWEDIPLNEKMLSSDCHEGKSVTLCVCECVCECVCVCVCVCVCLCVSPFSIIWAVSLLGKWLWHYEKESWANSGECGRRQNLSPGYASVLASRYVFSLPFKF